jgi:hypothetical protein
VPGIAAAVQIWPVTPWVQRKSKVAGPGGVLVRRLQKCRLQLDSPHRSHHNLLGKFLLHCKSKISAPICRIGLSAPLSTYLRKYWTSFSTGY